MSARRLFVAGATGAIGQALLPLADARQVSVIAHARPKSAAALAPRPVVALDLGDPKLSEALAGCTTVIQLIGTMKKRFASGDTYEVSDIGTTRQLLEAAQRAGSIDHFILLSSLGAGSPRGAYLKAKAEAERLVRESKLPWTIFRPSVFADRPGVFLPGVKSVTRLLGLKKYEPIKLRELAGALLAAAVDRGPLETVLEGEALWALVEKGA